VLFSDTRVAEFINEHFEPSWKSLRPVPIVTIDFGNGTKVRRTLHGNVATSVCTSDGKLLDVLPGIYSPDAYVDRLGELGLLHRYVTGRSSPRELRASALRSYHRQRATGLANGTAPLRFTEQPYRRQSITGIEKGTKTVLQPAPRIRSRAAHASGRTHASRAGAARTPGPGKDLSTWEALAEDTRVNETIRRRQIHEYLADKTSVTPDAVTKWLYREVLHADLDDPYLGLGKILFDAYPFEGEDR
jgi:hypothetical protein